MSRCLALVLLCFSFNLLATEQEDQYEEVYNPKLSEVEKQAANEPESKQLEPATSTDTKKLEEQAAKAVAPSTSKPEKELALPDQTKPIIPIVVGKSSEASASETTEEQKQDVWGPLSLLNTELSPNSTATLDWYSGHLPGGFELATPVVVIHGKEPGPRVCLTAAIHGDEVNGVEIARRVVQNLKPDDLKGTIISVPVVNIDGLWRKDRYMSDRRDLNRAFPGDPNGSTASRVAHSLFNSIIRHCDSVIDLHSGSMFRENVSQLRADITLPAVSELAAHFGAIPVLQSIAPPGSLRGAATAAGIPAVVMEVGGPFTVDVQLVETGVKALRSYLSAIEMLPRSFFWSSPQPVFYASEWVRSRQGGILINKVKLGQKVNKGQTLGVISNPINDEVETLYAPFNAVVLGRAQDQFVSAGYAVFNLGERRSIEDLEQQGEKIKQKVVEKNAEQMGLNNITEATEDTKTKGESIPPDNSISNGDSTEGLANPAEEEPPAESAVPDSQVDEELNTTPSSHVS
ncbi:succinylglutamate desuccinylase/aspartoacylase family protein [Agarivorans litoreus]|uniref:succinylglutamate desuccinylase/aspartoacylase family protein n=1 Tax=Agarivorans litoreus TaxID=1510455 RepID=UPI001C7D2442|nr:succinylglutamate desuccinylase/aspartoacylase family protein [Agarivorans litoreus]